MTLCIDSCYEAEPSAAPAYIITPLMKAPLQLCVCFFLLCIRARICLALEGIHPKTRPALLLLEEAQNIVLNKSTAGKARPSGVELMDDVIVSD